jgi:hypothetical protein
MYCLEAYMPSLARRLDLKSKLYVFSLEIRQPTRSYEPIVCACWL